MALITIDGVELPTPNQYNIPMQDMTSSDSSYSESGFQIRNRVRQGICRLELAWRVGGNDAATLLTAIKPDKVKVKYFDPRTGTQSEADMFVEDRSCSLISYKGDDNPDASLWEIAFNLMEY